MLSRPPLSEHYTLVRYSAEVRTPKRSLLSSNGQGPPHLVYLSVMSDHFVACHYMIYAQFMLRERSYLCTFTCAQVTAANNVHSLC